MPHLKGPEKALPKRPFHQSLTRDIETLGKVLDELTVHELSVQMPRVWGDRTPEAKYVVKMRTGFGDVAVRQDTFEDAVLSAIAAVEMLEGVAAHRVQAPEHQEE